MVVRSDSSGTTYVFTGHLDAVSEEFKGSVGQGKSPQWPKSNKFVKAPKNDGITATVKQTPDALGYIPLPDSVVATVREVAQKIQ